VRLTVYMESDMGTSTFSLTQSIPVHQLVDPIKSSLIWMSMTYVQSNP